MDSLNYEGKTYIPVAEIKAGSCYGCALTDLPPCNDLPDSTCSRGKVIWVEKAGSMPKVEQPVHSSANDVQVGGAHYKDRNIQPWDFIAANDLDYFQGNVVKYVTRFREKNGLQDLQKARHYLDKLIEIESEKQA